MDASDEDMDVFSQSAGDGVDGDNTTSQQSHCHDNNFSQSSLSLAAVKTLDDHSGEVPTVTGLVTTIEPGSDGTNRLSEKTIKIGGVVTVPHDHADFDLGIQHLPDPSSDDENFELSPLRDGGGDRIHTSPPNYSAHSSPPLNQQQMAEEKGDTSKEEENGDREKEEDEKDKKFDNGREIEDKDSIIVDSLFSENIQMSGSHFKIQRSDLAQQESVGQKQYKTSENSSDFMSSGDEDTDVQVSTILPKLAVSSPSSREFQEKEEEEDEKDNEFQQSSPCKDKSSYRTENSSVPDDDGNDTPERFHVSSPNGRTSILASHCDVFETFNFQNGNNVACVSSRGPDTVVEDLLQNVLDKVLDGVESDEFEHPNASGDQNQQKRFPELEKVELSSDEEGTELQERGFKVQRSLLTGDGDDERHHEMESPVLHSREILHYNSDQENMESSGNEEDGEFLERGFEEEQALSTSDGDDERHLETESPVQDSKKLLHPIIDHSKSCEQIYRNEAFESNIPEDDDPLDIPLEEPLGLGVSRDSHVRSSEFGDSQHITCQLQGKPSDASSGNGIAYQEENKRTGTCFELSGAASPRSEYPLNYNNYKVCRVLSPGVKECLILETGEQILYECTTRTKKKESSLNSSKFKPGTDSSNHFSDDRVNRERDKVKRDIFSSKRSSDEGSHAQDCSANSDLIKEVPDIKNKAEVLRAGGNRNLSHHSHAHVQRTRQQAEFNDGESHDGSYLWIQQQASRRIESKEDGEKIPQYTIGPLPGESILATSEMTASNRGSNTSIPKEGQNIEVGFRKSSISGLANTSGGVTSPGAIPNFKTLQDQQMSWLSMYRLIEDQHHKELKAQYAEHQSMIADMQEHLEQELLRQQKSMRQKLQAHKEALLETHSLSHRLPFREAEDRWEAGLHSDASKDIFSKVSDLNEHYQRTLNSHRKEWDQGHSPLRDNRSTSVSPGEGINKHSPEQVNESMCGLGQNKLLRGGVYSSPMPIMRPKSPHMHQSARSLNFTDHVHNSFSSEDGRKPLDTRESHLHHSRDTPFNEDDTLSPRTRISLREKHSKHLADLRAYYEAEMQELRERLSAVSDVSLSGRETNMERMLREENQSLRLRCQDLQDKVDDAHIHSRELEQKLQGLEIRSVDYAERYEESQRNVLKLKNRLEELHAYAKEKDTLLEEVKTSEQRQTERAESLTKICEEQAENLRHEKAALKRILDKHDSLEREYITLKETLADMDKKLFETRNETVDLNKIISRLELENKRLARENDNLLHRLAAGSSLSLPKEDMVEAVEKAHDRSSERLTYSSSSSPSRYRGHSSERSPRYTDRHRFMDVVNNEENDDSESSVSPLLKAERELRRLQESLSHSDFVPKLQPKKYSSEETHPSRNLQETLNTRSSVYPAPPYNGHSNVTIIDGLKSTRASSVSGSSAIPGESVTRKQKSKKNLKFASETKFHIENGDQNPKIVNKINNELVGLSSPTRFDVGVKREVLQSSPKAGVPGNKGRENSIERERERNHQAQSASKSSKTKNQDISSQSVDSTLNRIRAGEIVSRPQWEDVYTSLAKPRQSDKAVMSMTQESMLRERLHTVGDMERRYDELQVEKRKLESALNKIPSHGRVDRNSRKEKEDSEQKLEQVNRELGSLRMALKRYQVLKTSS